MDECEKGRREGKRDGGRKAENEGKRTEVGRRRQTAQQTETERWGQKDGWRDSEGEQGGRMPSRRILVWQELWAGVSCPS
ncbi:hypothetical protein EYF80_049386 [Liparis tanakae]|uniref:Uncharacterized protein n=1 Tax=Liparis tanakae TaxID=230148 RepID=A0A4Z2FI50_9TELE|nr:hypothetical protein EYF80_049386 [Liparis tanakae]